MSSGSSPDREADPAQGSAALDPTESTPESAEQRALGVDGDRTVLLDDLAMGPEDGSLTVGDREIRAQQAAGHESR